MFDRRQVLIGGAAASLIGPRLAWATAETERRVAHRAKQMGLDFPVLLDADGAAFEAWGGKGLPTSVLIDRGGTIRYLGLGPLEWDGADVVTPIEGLLDEGK